jgi:nicotinate-nucleotide pyrophosphorylase (carboxylating)
MSIRRWVRYYVQTLQRKNRASRRTQVRVEERFVTRDFHQIHWDDYVQDDCRQIVRLAIREDLDRFYDWTTVSLVPVDANGATAMVARQPGIVCGLRAAELALDEMEAAVQWQPAVQDGDAVAAGDQLAVLRGDIRDLLTAERVLLNLVGRLSGIATLTRRYVEAVRGTGAWIYDTRKTTPGWRRLEKYAVQRGGGRNHRTGLFDAILIKDNHLALACISPGEAVRRARAFIRETVRDPAQAASMIVEIEVDTLQQLEDVLPAAPDIVLLDNMPPETLREAVARRAAQNPDVQLEASGGVSLRTVRAIAESGVDRISVGALTHSAVSLDVGLDWRESGTQR